MKDTVLFLLCAIALAQCSVSTANHNVRSCNTELSEAQRICKSANNEDAQVVHRYCNMFYKCSNGKPYAYKCPSVLLYDPIKEECEWPHLVECGDRPISDNDYNISEETDCIDDDDDEQGNDVTTLPPSTDNDSDCDNIGGTCNCNPDEAPSICAKENSDGILIAHENCNQFYKCDHGKPVAFTCPPNTLYNPHKEQCDWAANVDCGDRLIPDPNDNDGSDCDNGDNGGNDNGGNDNGGSDNGGNENEGTCNCNPGEAPTICGGADSDGILIAHENCNQFYKCDHGKPVVFTCPPNTLYNPYKEQCDWAANVDCGDRLIPDPNENDGSDSDNDGNDDAGNDNGGSDNGGNENEGTCNCNPGEAPTICAGADSDGILIAHENCNQFYKCDHGKPVVFTCPPNTLYNPYKEECDWSSNVECGDRVMPESGEDDNLSSDSEGDIDDNLANDNENGGTCNCNPGEAPTICAEADSDGTLVAHENCNQFYKCDHGKPVVFTCPPNTLYNPYKEQCDWAANVDCSDRLIPDPNDNDGSDSDNDGNDDVGNDNGGNGNGGNENEGTCNCNPGEAPTICAGADSDGILIAHENCNQFYKCDHGKPVVFTCPPNTLYNPYKEQCDWAANVDCGDRLIPGPNDNDGSDCDNGDNGGNDNGGNDGVGSDNGGNENEGTCNCNPGEAPTICEGADSDGILIAHENCNQFYKCDHGKPVVFTCPPNTLYNPYKEQCDWAANVDCGDRLIPDPNDNDGSDSDNDGNDNVGNDNGGSDNGGNENEGTCNCNPGEAPTICEGADSDGILIAHENCNQFYKCDHGKPVVFTCPPNTLYNPYKEQCDWAANVDCGDRLIPDSNDNDGSDSDNDGNNDVGNDNGGNDNGGNENEGTCNCTPGEAPTICAGADSDGILIAHENCNQFYKCDHGKPVVFTCPPNTLYNPYKEQCDWAANVDCGDRLVPDPNDNDGSDSDNDGNNDVGNDNGGNDNGGNENEGTCNCNPGEAPTICAGADSDGILIAHENCNQFYKCDHGKPVVFTCPPNTLYNPYKKECDWDSNVECGDRVMPESGEDDNLSSDSEGDIDDNLANDNENGGTCNCNPGEAPTICAGANSEGILIAHENCNQFYKCDHGKPVAFTCPPNTLYDPYKQECDWTANVDCGDRVVPDSNDIGDNNNDDSNNGDNENVSTGDDDGGNDNNNNDNGCDGDSENDNGESCNCDPEQAPSICADENSNGVLIAHENCNQYYQCSNGNAVSFTCPGTLLYNPLKEECDWPNKVDCGDRIIPEPNSEEDSSNGSDDIIVNDPDDTASCNCNPSEAPSICASGNSEGVLVAHENCNQFYMCSNGLPIALKCPGKTLYNPYKEQCDWASEVKCGDRVISDSEDDDTVGDDNNEENDTDDEDNNIIHDDPSQAPTICAEIGSEGILVAHENCNQFYQCTGSLPIASTCAAELLFNPKIQECDWPHNVDCGDRILPETDDDCACNPRNAPALCRKENSDGKLIAHENCHQFYICASGVPVARYCPWSLVYNIEKEVCDWPQNVKCDNRLMVSYSSINKHFESRQNLRK